MAKTNLKVPTRQQVLDAVEKFLKDKAMPDHQFGRRIASDPNLVRELRGGREISLTMAGKIVRFMESK